MTFDYDDVKPKARTKLSIKAGILAGIIWGLFLSAYYTMFPNAKFAIICASVCFIALVAFVFAWPHIVRAFKEAAKEARLKREGGQ